MKMKSHQEKSMAGEQKVGLLQKKENYRSCQMKHKSEFYIIINVEAFKDG